MMVRAEERFSGTSPSQSYDDGSTTTLFIAVAAFVTCLTGSSTAILSGNHDSATIGVEEKFGVLETHSTRWIEWSVSAEPIDLSWSNIRDEGMPVVIGAVEDGIKNDDVRWLRILLIEKQQFDARGIARMRLKLTPCRDGRPKGALWPANCNAVRSDDEGGQDHCTACVVRHPWLKRFSAKS